MPSYTDTAEVHCPLCQSRVDRIRRTTFDRILSVVSPRRRYRCLSPLCTWEGVLKQGRKARREKATARPRTRHSLVSPRIEPHT